MNHFYITLPSDSSSNVYPDNTVAHFTTKLSERIHLDGDYEVGLSELIYPYSWINFNAKDVYVFFYRNGYMRTQIEFTFTSGHFRNERELLKHVNECMVNSSIEITLKMNEVSRKMSLLLVNKDETYRVAFYMSDKFAEIFGFEGMLAYEMGEHISETSCDIHAGLRLMYIYSDIASYSAVGDTRTPLLRVCNTSGLHGETTRVSFNQPHYMPVARHDIETIEININNELGMPMPFLFGKSVVTLHFRPK
jgi:hypothetical protein